MKDKDEVYLIEIRKPLPLPNNAIIFYPDGSYETVKNYKKRKGITKYPRGNSQK